jgi:hypothetical protein
MLRIDASALGYLIIGSTSPLLLACGLFWAWALWLPLTEELERKDGRARRNWAEYSTGV